MFLEKIKAKLQCLVKDALAIDDYISNYGKDDDCDIDVKTAIHNYEAHQNDLRQSQQNLVKKWCKEIKEASSKGEKFIFTNKFVTDDDKNKILFLIDDAGCACDFSPDSSMQYFYEYFEEKGFKVVKIEYPMNNICCLKIIWISSNNN